MVITTPANGGTTPHMRAVGRSVLTKAVTLPVTAIATVVTTRITVGSVGLSGYALVTLVATLPTMIPIGDLGVGAAIVSALAQCRDGDREPLRATLVAGARTLGVAGVLLAALGIIPAMAGLWTPLLGKAAEPGTDSCVAVAFTVFGCSLSLCLGKSLLIALNRAHVALLMQAVGSVLAVGVLVAAAAVHAPLAVFAASGLAAQCVMGVACLLLAGRSLRMPLLSLMLRSWRRNSAGRRIRHLALPMLVINAGSSVAYATDRLVLSHVTDSVTVAVYSAGAQLYTPALGVISVAGMPLWTLFAHQRASGVPPSRGDLVTLTLTFAAGAALMGSAFVTLGPALGSWMVHDQQRLGFGLMAAFGILLFLQTVNYPVSMWLTDEVGLRFQAVRVSVMAVVNLALSIPLAHLLGAPGPVIGSVVAFSTVVLVPSLRRALSHA